MVLATDANLKVLFCSGSEVASLLLAAQRLQQLSPRLAFDASVEGAVVGHTDSRGKVALRRVVRVVHAQLDTQGQLLLSCADRLTRCHRCRQTVVLVSCSTCERTHASHAHISRHHTMPCNHHAIGETQYPHRHMGACMGLQGLACGIVQQNGVLTAQNMLAQGCNQQLEL